MKRLPEAEFEVMKAIWKLEPPVTTGQIADALEEPTRWKAQTILTLLTRLTKKGFLESTKRGKERIYVPLVLEKEYLEYETNDFVKKYHNNSITKLINTLYDGKTLESNDIDELKEWLNKRG